MIFTIALFSCQGDQPQGTISFDIDTKSFSEDKLTDRFELKEIIVFDTIADAFITSNFINNLIFADNKLIVSASNPRIKFFDAKTVVDR